MTNLARPGGNLTGFWSFEPDMGGKWLSGLKETAANMRRVALLFGSDTPIDLAIGLSVPPALLPRADEVIE